MKSIVLIADYFGSWPEWFPVFVASCAANPTIHWLIHTDCPAPDRCPPNMNFRPVSRSDYCRRVSDALDINFAPQSMYNICGLRPSFADIYASEVSGFDYVGWCDIDLVFGDLRHFLTDRVLEKDVVTTSSDICTGHLTLLRNTPSLRVMYRDIPDWRARMSDPRIPEWTESLDEAWLSRLCSPIEAFRNQAQAGGVAAEALDRYRSNNHFKEQWVTPFVPFPWLDGDRLHPEIWYWSGGSLTNWRDGAREFPYLHLMNLKARRYVDADLYALAPTWSDGVSILAPNALSAEVIRIDRCGMRGTSFIEAAAEREQLGAFSGPARLAAPRDEAEMDTVLGEAVARGVQWLEGGAFLDPASVLSPQLRGALAGVRGVAANRDNAIPAPAGGE